MYYIILSGHFDIFPKVTAEHRFDCIYYSLHIFFVIKNTSLMMVILEHG